MMNTNITSAREQLYSLASSCIKYNNIININTKEGNVIMMRPVMATAFAF